MSRASLIRSASSAGALAVIMATLAACSIGQHSCADFNDAYKEPGRPRMIGSVKDAYFSEHSDKDSVTFGQIAMLVSVAHKGCEANPDGNVEDFV